MKGKGCKAGPSTGGKLEEYGEEEAMEQKDRDWMAWGNFLNSRPVGAMKTCFTEMHERVLAAKSMGKEGTWFKAMKRLAVATEPVDVREVIEYMNPRFFVVDSEGRYSCAIPLVQDELLRWLDERGKGVSLWEDQDLWRDLEYQFEKGLVPGSVGTAVEKCCHGALAVGSPGYRSLLPEYTARPKVHFFNPGDEAKEVGAVVNKFKAAKREEEVHMFIPRTAFYEGIDHVLVGLKERKEERGGKKGKKGQNAKQNANKSESIH